LFEPDGALVPAKPVPDNPFVRNGKSVVAMVHGLDEDAMLRRGLEMLGGIDRLAVSGRRVLIKPNVVNDRAPPSTTSPRVVAAVVRLLRAAGAVVTVADSSGMLRFPTVENLQATGVQKAAEEAGATVLALEDQPWVRVQPPLARSVPKFYVSRPVYEADVFLNLPIVKTHRFAHYSCALKNLVGIVHPRYRPSLSFLSGDWHERIAELNLAVHPHLTVADATTMMIAGGPTTGTPEHPHVLLFSGDRVALDAVAVAMIRSFGSWPKVAGSGVWRQRQIVRAVELGLGAAGPDRVELTAESIEQEREEFERLVERIRADLASA
jgi:uncharacterized protein (DUF362 family)